jgi:hypothetical protein
MRRLSAIIALGAALLAVPALADAPSGDVLRILDQFMVARSAATRCGTATPITMSVFRSNYREVALQARAELKSILSDLADAPIEKVIADHYDDIDRRIAVMIAQESCDGPHTREELQKYDSGAQMVTARLATNKPD